MAKSNGKCKICSKTVTVGSSETPPDIAAEGVMESIQEHIFQEHCDDNLELKTNEYDSVGQAWEYV